MLCFATSTGIVSVLGWFAISLLTWRGTALLILSEMVRVVRVLLTVMSGALVAKTVIGHSALMRMMRVPVNTSLVTTVSTSILINTILVIAHIIAIVTIFFVKFV